jgi:nucleoside-diphosphate-sugar epimerase
LIREGKEVILLTRDPERVPRALATDVAVLKGSLGSLSSFQAALQGCDEVIHCAKSDHPVPEVRAREDIEGTSTLLRASISAQVRRFQQLSTISVYGITPDGIVNETFAPQPTADHYSKSKAQIEQEVLGKSSEIEVVVLQAANVYGPGHCWWSHTLLNMMRRGTVILVNEGRGLANMVHVSDLVDAILLASRAPKISGERFIISDGRPILWRDYFRALEKIIGRRATLELPAEKAKTLSRKLLAGSPLGRARRAVGRALFNEPIIFPLADEAIDRYGCQTVFSIEKAVTRLRYQPVYDLARGLETVREFESNQKTSFEVRNDLTHRGSTETYAE